MSDNIDKSDVNNGKQQVDDKNGGIIIKFFLFLVGIILGTIFGNAGKKKAVDAAYERGYKDASNIYKKKFKKQHDAFIKQEKNWKEHEEEYRQLIADYEEYIEKLESDMGDEKTVGKIKFFEDKLEELQNLEKSC